MTAASAPFRHLGFGQQVWRGPELLAEGDIRIGCVDHGTFKPRRIPTPLLDTLTG